MIFNVHNNALQQDDWKERVLVSILNKDYFFSPQPFLPQASGRDGYQGEAYEGPKGGSRRTGF